MRPVVGRLQEDYPNQFRFRSYDFDIADQRAEAIAAHGLPVHPSFALYGRDGALVERIIGAVPADVLRAKIAALIEAP
ncbi:MAG TPA: thioredoxin family protein [Herpetosiphonaceae bacterium]|nr:thioredoxin family protein [Herpetosiphonaceae bacterium]